MVYRFAIYKRILEKLDSSADMAADWHASDDFVFAHFKL